VVFSAATVELVVGATVELVAILLEVVLGIVVDVKAFVVVLVVELVGVGVSDPGPCAKAQFEQWYEVGE